jgi:hypothetical protein
MGIRFNIQSANWIAYIIEPDASVPNLASPQEEYVTLKNFLEGLRDGFFSSMARERQLYNQIDLILRAHFKTERLDV